jgi:hypothetical protein
LLPYFKKNWNVSIGDVAGDGGEVGEGRKKTVIGGGRGGEVGAKIG